MKCSIFSILIIPLMIILSTACSDSNDDKTIDGDTDQQIDGDTSTDGDSDSNESPDLDDSDGEESDTETEAPIRLVDLVNPFIGSGGLGFSVGSGTPAATRPFGMVKVGPDTEKITGDPVFYHCSGYHYDDDMIDGFSHVRLYGTGMSDLGVVSLMPTIGPITEESIEPKNYVSYFDKETEEAHPGYYKVNLKDTGIKVELTATERAAHHRYNFPQTQTSGENVILMDLSHATPGTDIIDGGIIIIPDKSTIEGWIRDAGPFSRRFGHVDIHFVGRFNREFVGQGTWKDGVLSDAMMQSGPNIGAYLAFDGGDTSEVEAQLAISYISIENARENLDAEMPDWDFDGTRQTTEDAWEDTLSVIRFAGGEDYQQIIMATALYHAYMMPDIFSDVNGEYLGFDNEVHTAENYTMYANFSLWDTYRTEHPLLTLLDPEHTRDMMISLTNNAKQGGYLPRWPLANGYTNTMLGASADIVVADAYLKNVTDFDIEAAYSAMLLAADNPVPPEHKFSGRDGIEEYIADGYVNNDKHSGSVAKTLEYTVADFAISQLAQVLNKPDDKERFTNRSNNYRNLWHEETQFLLPKNSDGSFETDISFTSWQSAYTEGTAWQYLWLTPHDIGGLMDLFPSPEAMAEKLNTFFEEGQKHVDSGPLAEIDPPAHYWHGNEPDIHAAYMFLQAGRPDLTQKWVQWISERLYNANANGIAGNDDCGTLSSWYVFSSIGFYPLTGTQIYLIGKPLFPHIEISLSSGTLIIEAPNVSNDNIYVQDVTFNGESLATPWFTHEFISSSGTLHFEMGPEPGEWGKVTPDQRPPFL